MSEKILSNFMYNQLVEETFSIFAHILLIYLKKLSKFLHNIDEYKKIILIHGHYSFVQGDFAKFYALVITFICHQLRDIQKSLSSPSILVMPDILIYCLITSPINKAIITIMP